MIIEWPQIVWIFLTLISLMDEGIKVGRKQKTGGDLVLFFIVNFWINVVLYYGGFWRSV